MAGVLNHGTPCGAQRDKASTVQRGGQSLPGRLGRLTFLVTVTARSPLTPGACDHTLLLVSQFGCSHTGTKAGFRKRKEALLYGY